MSCYAEGDAVRADWSDEKNDIVAKGIIVPGLYK